MALIVKDEEIVGTIDNLEKKLSGKLPITREELLVLVNSWGRSTGFYTKDSKNRNIYIKGSKATQSEQALLVRKECYDLSKLDVSEITNMGSVFCFSNFNNIHSSNGVGLHNDIHSTNGIGLHNGNIGNWNVSNVTNMIYMFSFAREFNSDISNWNVSNVTDISYMFGDAENFNQPLNDWDVRNVINMEYMFYQAWDFNQPLNNWNTSKVTNMYGMFCGTEKFNQNISSWIFNDNTNINSLFEYATAFQNKYNNGNHLPSYTDEIKEWFKENRDKMNDLDLKDKHGEEINNFFNKLQTNSIQKKEIQWH